LTAPTVAIAGSPTLAWLVAPMSSRSPCCCFNFELRRQSVVRDNGPKNNKEFSMQPVEVTFQRAFKVWWSYTWRAWVLWVPVFVVIAAAIQLSGVTPHNQGSPRVMPSPEKLRHDMKLVLEVWPVLIVGLSIVQTFAMRWCLKTPWSDFRLVAVAPDQSNALR
jgi:hypothetical protein